MEMKLTLICTTIILLSFSHVKDSPKDFDYKLSEIAREFTLKIMNKDGCEKLKTASDDIAEDIEGAMKKVDEYTSEEIIELRKLKVEAEALEEFIAAVGNCGTAIPSIENFNLANRRVRANVAIVTEDQYCVHVISVTIGEYVAYLGKNISSKNYTVAYKWKARNGLNTGNGTMGLPKLTVRHIYDNREERSQKNIVISGITCKEF